MKKQVLQKIAKKLFSKNGVKAILRKSKRAVSLLLTDGWRGVWVQLRQNYYQIARDAQTEASMEMSGQTADGNNWTGYAVYDSEYQPDGHFPEHQPDVKALAFYLPQFHTFPENDEWWGKGFTEWRNTRACTEPRFAGHYQPRTPHPDIGYYDLSDFDVMRKQIASAKRHGIYGFCFYYYWFSGKRLMEKPVDQLMEHPEVDMPFCLCWANENWTRAWDGQNKQILIRQKYREEDDALFIRDIKRYIDDPRYIRVNGKPVIIVYNPGQIPNCRAMFNQWRKEAQEQGIGEILIWTCATSNNSVEALRLTDCVDGEVEFPPHNMWFEAIGVRGLDLKGKSAMIYNYQLLVNLMEKQLEGDEKSPVPRYHACTLGWDNSARRKDNWFMLYAFSLHGLYRWMRALVRNARKNKSAEDRFIFINAWNEWAEGTYLEPDEKYGYANINTVSKALYDLPYDEPITVLCEKDPYKVSGRLSDERESRIAMHVHLFYTELADEIIGQLNHIPYAWDAYVTTDTEEKKAELERKFAQKGKQRRLQVAVVENRGRDVLPFIEQMRGVLDRYDYVGHIHGKRTKTGDYGGEWRKYCLWNLLGSEAYLKRLFELLEKEPKLGLVFPATFPPLRRQAEWGGNQPGVQALLEQIGCITSLPQDPVFPVGNMFWARTDAIRPVLEKVESSQFPEEAGQVNATIAHCIERCWVYVARARGYGYRQVFNNCAKGIKLREKKRLALYVHYDANDCVSAEDETYLCAIRRLCERLVVVSNSRLDGAQKAKLERIADDVILHENSGYDFAAWRDSLAHVGWDAVERYDELILANNSLIGPYIPMEEMFEDMEERGCDFWGPTLFPLCPDGSYLNMPEIPEHLQSYFLVFNRRVIKSHVFRAFWQSVENIDDFKQVIARYESQLTGRLAKAGFTYEPYLLETRYMDSMLGRSDMPYTKPWLYLLLRLPFVKKKYRNYISDEDELILDNLLRQMRLDASEGATAKD